MTHEVFHESVIDKGRLKYFLYYYVPLCMYSIPKKLERNMHAPSFPTST